MFMTNDPWIGATHQNDLAVLAPVFWEDRVFAWVGSSLHHQDLGGTAPGGFNPVAENIFSESGVVPPVRIVEDGELRTDLEEEYMRRSRMPELVAVDLRAQIAGCRVAVERMESLLDRYGAPTLKGVMRKIQDDSERAFVSRLETIPDGEWRAEAFLEMAGPGDRNLYRNSLVLRKRGGRLEFSNEGTDPQIGTLSCTLAAWSGAISAMVNSQLMFDQLFAIGGALRRIDFKAEPGTLTSALHPSALSLAVLTLDQCIALAALCVSKMLSCSEDAELHKEIQSSMGAATFPIAAFSGSDPSGRIFASLFLDPVAAGMAGWSWRDGLDVGGWPWDPQVAMPNVEETEAFYPFLHLWRRVVPDSGGAGKYRGGNSMELAVIPHGVDQILHHTASAAHHAVPMSPLFGGYPSNVNRFILQRDTDAMELLESGRIPAPDQAKVGNEEELEPKAFGVPQNTGDIYVLRWCGAGGYGDPLDRDPETVARDVAAGAVTAESAEQLYCVVLSDGGVDADATEKLRADAIEARRGWSGGGEGSKNGQRRLARGARRPRPRAARRLAQLRQLRHRPRRGGRELEGRGARERALRAGGQPAVSRPAAVRGRRRRVPAVRLPRLRAAARHRASEALRATALGHPAGGGELMAYLGVDIGGTFTDIVHLDDDGSVVSTKSSSTPPEFERGFLAAVDKVAGMRGISSESCSAAASSSCTGRPWPPTRSCSCAARRSA